MTKIQKAKLQMAEALKLLFAASTAATTGKVALLAKITELSNRINAITALESTQQSITTGVTQNKENLRLTMQNLALAIIGPLIAYARATANTTLEQEIGFTLSDLQFSNETLCQERCQLVRDRANTNVLALADYDINATKITSLQTAVSNFGAVIGAPKSAAAQKKSATDNLIVAFTQLDATLTDLDGLMQTYKNTNAGFLSSYNAARKIITTGVRHQSLIVTVKDSVTHELLKNCSVNIAGTSTTRKTSVKGRAVFFSLDAGNISIIVSQVGYIDSQVHNIAITVNAITKIEINLVINAA